jgi:putative serine protease PepD
MNVVTRVRLLAATGFSAALLTACSGAVTVPVLGGVGIQIGSTPATQSSPVKTTSASLSSLQSAFTQIAKAVSPSVVEISTPNGLGSGIVYDSEGDIVTNAHVVSGSTSFTVTDSNGKKYSASLVGVDQSHDLAVIKVNATGLKPATFGNSSQLQVGDIVMAIGNPYGLQNTVTEGVVSALNRSETESSSSSSQSPFQGSQGPTLTGLIQTSAAINPGNSGGALVNLQGQVVGMPTLGSSTGSGVGFAINSNQIVSVANQLIQSGSGL